jgi:hypothetical protein
MNTKKKAKLSLNKATVSMLTKTDGAAFRAILTFPCDVVTSECPTGTNTCYTSWCTYWVPCE